jgi:hypothetical protein
MTIVWGETGFRGPHLFGSCMMPTSSGVYAIMIKTDSNTYKIIYFGESSKFDERITSFHHKYDCWKRQAGSDIGIYFGLHVMPTSTLDYRLQLESSLIQRFNPVCNY